MKKTAREMYSKTGGYIRSALSGIEIALLVSFMFLLMNSLFFEPYTGVKTTLLPNVDIDERELSRLYASALGLFLCIRILIASRKYTAVSYGLWVAVIAATVSVNVGVTVLVTGSMFAFTVLLAPMGVLIFLQLKSMWLERPVLVSKTIVPSAYLLCAALWILVILFSGERFKIEQPLPEGSISRIEDEMEEMLAGRDPCMFPSADILLTPFGYWTLVRTNYDLNCGADGLVSRLGADTVSTLLVVKEWMGEVSLSTDDISVEDLLLAQAYLNQMLEDQGEAILETQSGRIILQSSEYVDGSLLSEPEVIVEDVENLDTLQE